MFPHGGNRPATNRPRPTQIRVVSDKNQTDDAIFLVCSRDFHGARRRRRRAAAEQRCAARLAPLPMLFRSLERTTNLEPTFRDNLARSFSTPAHGNGVGTGNEHFAPFISIRQTGTVRAVDTKCSRAGKEGGGGDVLKVVQIEGVVELALGQNIHGFMLVTRTRFLRQQIENREISTREVIRSL